MNYKKSVPSPRTLKKQDSMSKDLGSQNNKFQPHQEELPGKQESSVLGYEKTKESKASSDYYLNLSQDHSICTFGNTK